MERVRRRAGEQVDVRKDVQVETVAADPAKELVVLAGVPAGLVDDEAGARPHLLAQLEVLGHHLAFVPLVVRDDPAQEEVRPLERRGRSAHVRQAHVHIGEEADQPDRVDVEDRGGEPTVAHDRVVAGQREDVLEARRAELPAATLERIAVPVLAGEVDDHLLPARDQVGPERVGREHGVPTGVVRDREDVDPWVGGEIPREREHPCASLRGDRATARDELRDDDEAARSCEGVAERGHVVSRRRRRRACRTCGSSRSSARPSTDHARAPRRST